MLKKLLVIFGLCLVTLTVTTQLYAASATLSESTYKRLSRVHEMIGNGQYDAAISGLDKLVSGKRGYEKAIVLQTYGYAYSGKGNYGKAAEYFKQCLDMNVLPEKPQLSMMYNLGQIYIADNQFQKGISLLETWFSKTDEIPSSQAHMLIATAYAEIKRYAKAIPHVKSAIKKSKKPQEAWYQLLLAMYYELKQYNNAVPVLETLIQLSPDKKQYWTQLSSTYINLQNNVKALATMELAYKKGLYTEGKEYINLSNMYMFQDIPYKAAEVLAAGFERGIIEDNFKNRELLANSWTHARETKKAIVALQHAAGLAPNGDVYVRLGQQYVSMEEWKSAKKALSNGLAKGGVKNVGAALLLLGLCNYQLQDYDSARQAFNKAKKYGKYRKQAVQWIDEVDRKLKDK